MEITIHVAAEHNEKGVLLYAVNFPGAFTRGVSQEEAMAKWDREIASYLRWRDGAAPAALRCVPRIVQDRESALHVEDADSDILFDSEAQPMDRSAYQDLKALALRSAADFLDLYQSLPDKDRSPLPVRSSFYGPVPRTGREMYRHTKSVNSYYFGEIGVAASNEPDILRCREAGFAALERTADFLSNPVFHGSCGEDWSTGKVLRRFLWHDRIHARAMARMAALLWGRGACADPFRFGML